MVGYGEDIHAGYILRLEGTLQPQHETHNLHPKSQDLKRRDPKTPVSEFL